MRTTGIVSHQQSQSASATVVVVVLLAILMIVVTADFVTVRTLNSDLKLIEEHQVGRISGSPPPAKTATTNNLPHG